MASACHWMNKPENAQLPEARGQAVCSHFLDALWQLAQEVQA
ncbi:hypothetical protein ACNKHM_23115 [Shigella sonnei]